MNTEKLNAYKQLVEVEKEVNTHRTIETLGKPERADLDKLAIALEEMSWEIISNDITKILKSLTVRLEDIKKINEQMAKKNAQLNALSEKIEKVTKVLGTLIDITTKALAVGLIQ